MKNFRLYHAIAPVLALFAVGCSSPTAMQSTEYDDMYYSSSDRTEYIQPQAQTSDEGYDSYTSTEEGAVRAESSSSNVTDNYYSDEYYDGRTYRPQSNWDTPNYAYVDPYWTNSYVTRYNPYYSPYTAYRYDPFYDPFFYGPAYPRSGLMVSIGVSYGMGWGSPYYPYSNRWWPYNNYYSGFYHGYHHGYYGGTTVYYDNAYRIQPRKVQYGPRGERSEVPASGSGRISGRPDRIQSVTDEQRAVQPGTEYARPGRAERSNINTDPRGQQQQVNPAEDGRQVLPARPRTTRGYDPESGQVRPSRQQPANEQRIERMSPAREERRVSPPAERSRPVYRQERSQPIQRQERIQPVQREQRSSSPAYERRESSQPVRSYEPSRESSGSSSPPARSNSNSGGGRPGRGQ